MLLQTRHRTCLVHLRWLRSARRRTYPYPKRVPALQPVLPVYKVSWGVSGEGRLFWNLEMCFVQMSPVYRAANKEQSCSHVAVPGCLSIPLVSQTISISAVLFNASLVHYCSAYMRYIDCTCNKHCQRCPPHQLLPPLPVSFV